MTKEQIDNLNKILERQESLRLVVATDDEIAELKAQIRDLLQWRELASGAIERLAKKVDGGQ